MRLSDADNQFWVYANEQADHSVVFAEDWADKCDGAFVIAPAITPTVEKMCDTYRGAGKPVVLGFRESLRRPDLDRLHHARELTDLVALATSGLNEWSPLQPVKKWVDFAEQHSMRWCCSFIQCRLAGDVKSRDVQRQLVEHKVPVFCLCGWMLARYACGVAMPGTPTALTGLDLEERFGLNAVTLKSYLDPLWAIAGVQGKAGLATGNRVYCDQMGFTGSLAGGPFTDDDVAATVSAATPPLRPGVYTVDHTEKNRWRQLQGLPPA